MVEGGDILTETTKTKLKNIKVFEKVLIVDDNITSNIIMEKTFTKNTCIKFKCVTSVKDAIDELTNNYDSYFCLLLDYHLPDGNGVDVLDHIKTNMPHVDCLPFICVTCDNRESVIVEMLRLHAFDYIDRFDCHFFEKLFQSIIKIHDSFLLKNKLFLSEVKFKRIIEDVPNVAVQCFSRERVVKFWNHASELIYGYSKDEVIGKKIEDLIVFEEDKEDVVNLIETCIQEGKINEPIEVALRRKNGTRVSIQSSYLSILNEDGDFEVYCIDVDITERDCAIKKLMEEKAKNEELIHLFESIANNLPDMMWAKDLNGKYLFANKAVCDGLLNCTLDEYVGKGDAYFAERIREKHIHTFGARCADSDYVVLENDVPTIFHEYGTAIDTWLDLEVHKAPLRNNKGEVIGTVGSGRDITEREMLKRQLAEKDDQLVSYINNAFKDLRH